MKLKISFALISLYLMSLVMTAPAALITPFIPGNAGIKIGSLSGTLWNGQLSQVNYRNQVLLQKLTWKFDWLALLQLKLKADLKFNNGRAGIASVVYGFSGLVVSDVNVKMDASELIPYLKLPITVKALGRFTLVVENVTQGLPYCTELDGYLVWHDAKLETELANIDLASPSVDLSCVDGGVMASLTQDSDQLTTHANILLTEGDRYQLEGDIIGHENLEATVLQAISWIGPQQASGETLLSFKGKL